MGSYLFKAVMTSEVPLQEIKPMYNTSVAKIECRNDAEYRECLRTLFYMKHIPVEGLEGLDDTEMDEVTADELNLDETAMSAALDYLFSKTKDCLAFQEVYDIAAGFMFSTDRSIGLTVLFSYDYLPLFHACLCCFLETPELFGHEQSDYVALRKKLER